MFVAQKSYHRRSIITALQVILWVILLLTGTLSYSATLSHVAKPVSCTTGALPPGNTQDPPDLVVNTGTCMVKAGAYHYHNVNVYGGGSLQFVDDGNIDFWAESILIEKDGSLIAGGAPPAGAPFSHILTIHLWGKDQGVTGAGIRCLTDDRCGVAADVWTRNCPTGKCTDMFPKSCTKDALPGGVTDCFYPYQALDYDDKDDSAYFGYKVLAVSYGGTLQLFGKKGASYDANIDTMPWSSGTSWARLNADLAPHTSTVTLDRVVDWEEGDQIVVTTTDYLPGHSEQLTVMKNDTSSGKSVLTITGEVNFQHRGTTYNLGTEGKNVPLDIGPEQDPNVHCTGSETRCIETRAAVGLLHRSIRIVSEGDADGKSLPPPNTDCGPEYDPDQPNACVFFGGHTIVRQGVQRFQVQGVEFYQMGQGGRIMHYPIHFHMARQLPQATFVKDSSVWDSMNRWYTIHASQGVTLARNVGYLSIGSGYYLEDGSETENKLYSNLGVFARSGISNPQNPRQVPGILVDPGGNGVDAQNPTVFWMTNGWNDFKYNVASGAGSCGLCYWYVPANVSGSSQYEHWFSYAGEQQGDVGVAGTTPLKSFVGNACSAAEYSFMTIGATSACLGGADLKPVGNKLPHDNPRVDPASSRQATKCPTDNPSDECSVTACAYGQEAACAITNIDHYTTSFNWATLDLGAIWLRKQWYLFSNSAVTDVQQGGLTFVSGGGYTGSDEVPGYWALAHRDVFVGNTQPLDSNPFASNAGPFNPKGLQCDSNNGSYCASFAQGISMPLNNFGVFQRLFSIYDGPAYQESNAYLDITSTKLDGCNQDLTGTGCKLWMNAGPDGGLAGILWSPEVPDVTKPFCYQPNAAIAWKQPNGFYYPPAFHSKNLFFDEVQIRHFVIEPLFMALGDDGYHTDLTKAQLRYCGKIGDDSGNIFTGFTDIDRQTELSDDDGSLTGLLGPSHTVGEGDPPSYSPSISVNKDAFFSVPLETAECSSDIIEVMPKPLGQDCPYNAKGKQVDELCATANTSPYNYVTTVIIPSSSSDPGYWNLGCDGPYCYGVPLEREDVNPGESGATPIRMMGQKTGQRSSLTVDHARYYIDTTVSKARQDMWPTGRSGQHPWSVFNPGTTYNVFLLFGKPTTAQTYDIFVGTTFKPDQMLKKIRVDQEPAVPMATDAGTFDCGENSKECSFDAKTGYLTVTLDLSGSQDAYTQAAKNACKPDSFCKWDDTANSCGCNSSQTSASPGECANACKNWATKDVRCPKDATGKSQCYGFAFTLPGEFPTDLAESMPPPHVQCFNKEANWQTYWDVKFASPTSKTEPTPECDYKALPGPAQFCPGVSSRPRSLGQMTGAETPR